MVENVASAGLRRREVPLHLERVVRAGAAVSTVTGVQPPSAVTLNEKYSEIVPELFTTMANVEIVAAPRFTLPKS